MEPAVYWTMIAAIATAVSAVATMASAVVIAIQAVLTRKALAEAKRSADASEHAVVAAADSLELAREQARHSELMTAEAIRSRMEANGPAVFLTFTDTNENGPRPYAYARADAYDAQNLDQIMPGETVWAGRDDDAWMFAIMRVKLENATSKPVVINPGLAFAYFANESLTRRHHQVHIPANEAVRFFLAVGCRVSEWIRATHAEDRARSVVASSAWSTDVEGETGVRVRQLLRIQGTLLGSGPGKGAYTLRALGPDPMQNYPSRFVVEKQKREYIVGRDELGNPRFLPATQMLEAAEYA